MKSKVSNKKNNFVQEKLAGESDKKKDAPSELMKRLASGQKSQVDMKEMKKINNKNYENLPEIKKRKDEERKKEEFKKRQQLVKKY